MDWDLRKTIQERSRPWGRPACNHMPPGVYYLRLCFKGNCVEPVDATLYTVLCTGHATLTRQLTRRIGRQNQNISMDNEGRCRNGPSYPRSKESHHQLKHRAARLPIVQPRTSYLDRTEYHHPSQLCVAHFNSLVLKLRIFKIDFGIIFKNQKTKRYVTSFMFIFK